MEHESSHRMNVPNPNQLHPLGLAIGIGVFVGAFLLIFRPFGLIINGYGDPAFWLILGIIPLNVFLVIILDWAIKWLRQHWTWLTNKSAAVFTTVSVIIAGNVAYQAAFQEITTWPDLLEMIGQVALIAAFPTLFVLLYYRKQPTEQPEARPLEPSDSPLVLHDEAQRETLTLLVDDILYIESDRNYALIHTRISPKPHLLRSSLKALEQQIEGTPIIRCHRSYLVNTTQVIHRRRSARKVQLTLRDCDTRIPVSLQFVERIEDALSGE
ncbi:MAG: LytTR family transcriptional regulator [Rhodothermaceae bacterium]|nr:LytTR family transcriptional regulator [Rhodothermaceae bacterium]